MSQEENNDQSDLDHINDFDILDIQEDPMDISDSESENLEIEEIRSNPFPISEIPKDIDPWDQIPIVTNITDQDNLQSSIFRLCNKTLYYKGFLIEKNKSYCSLTDFNTRFKKRHISATKTLEKIKFLVKYDNGNIKTDLIEMFKLIKHNVVEEDGVVFYKTKVKFRDRPLVEVYCVCTKVSGSNYDMCPNFNTIEATAKGSVIEAFFNNRDMKNIEFKNEITSDFMELGRKIFHHCYVLMTKDPKLSIYTGSSIAFRDGNERFIRILNEKTINNYGSSIGRFLSLLYYRSDLDIESKDCEEFNCNLFEEDIDNNANSIMEFFVEQARNPKACLCKLLIAPYVFNHVTKRYYSSLYVSKLLDGLKFMIKISMLLKLNDSDFYEFKDKTCTSELYNYISIIYIRCLNETTEKAIFKVSNVSPGIVYVNDTCVKKEYLRDIYLLSIAKYDEIYEKLCAALGQHVSINHVYMTFLEGIKNIHDYESKGLVCDLKSNKFLESRGDLSIICGLIDILTKCLFCAIYIALANTIRCSELQVINIAAPTIEERNVIFRHKKICLVTFFGKNRKFNTRERYLPEKLSKLVINHCYLIKPLLLSIISQNLDETQIKLQQCNLFTLSNSMLTSLDHYYSTVGMLFGVAKAAVIKTRVIRQAVAYFVRHEVRINSFDSYSKFIERAQGHHWMSLDITYGMDGEWDQYLSSSNSLIMYRFFNCYAIYLGIDDDNFNVDDNVSEKKIVANPQSIGSFSPGVDAEDIIVAKKKCNYQFKNEDQDLLILEVCWGPIRSRTILAATGFGKTFFFLVPFLAFKSALSRGAIEKRIVNVLLVPYLAVVEDFSKRLKPYVNLITRDEIQLFNSKTDLILGSFDMLRCPDFINFISNFNLSSYGKTSQLGIMVIDEIQVIIEEDSLREFSKLNYFILKKFKKIITLGATIPNNFEVLMKEKLLEPKIYNCVKSIPNDNVFTKTIYEFDDEKRFYHLLAIISKFNENYPKNTLLIYYCSIKTLEEHYKYLSNLYKDNVISILSKTNDLPAVIEKTKSSNIICCTRSLSVGFDLPRISSIIFWEPRTSIGETIQVLGRLRNCYSLNLFLCKKNWDKPGCIDTDICFTQQLADFYNIKSPTGHHNCCIYELITNDPIRRIVDNLTVTSEDIAYQKRMTRKRTIDDDNNLDRIGVLIQKSIETIVQLDKKFKKLDIKTLGLHVTTMIKNFSDAGINRNKMLCNNCLLPKDRCIHDNCIGKFPVMTIIGIRYLLFDLEYHDINNIIRNGLGEQQLLWFDNNKDELNVNIKKYQSMLDNCSYIGRPLRVNDYDELNKQYENCLKLITNYQPENWIFQVFGVGDVNSTQLAQYGEFPSNWKDIAKITTFKNSNNSLCDKCGYWKQANEIHQCVSDDIILYFYVIFGLDISKEFRGNIKLFNHWIHGLVNCKFELQHQIIMLKLYNKMESFKYNK